MQKSTLHSTKDMHSPTNDVLSVLTGVLILLAFFAVVLLLLAITVLPKSTISAIKRKFRRRRNSDYDDGKDFRPLNKQQQEKLLRRKRIEEKRQQEAARQQQQREHDDLEAYRRAVQREARQREDAERIFSEFIDILEQEYYREQLRRRAKWDEQEERRQRQQQQQKGGRQQSSNKQQQQQQPQQRSRFEGMMGYGAQVLPDGCEGPVQEVLLAVDYYQVLGLTQSDVTIESLKAARKAKVLSVHPDKVGHDTPGANVAGGRVNVAYETLSCPQLRREYDSWLATQHAQQRSSKKRHTAAASSSSTQ